MISASLKESLEKAITDGYVRKIEGPNGSFILNYTPKTDKLKNWGPEILISRGLVCSKDWKILARPFLKFFEVEQIEAAGLSIPEHTSVEVYEKMDGSLGILRFEDDKPIFSTRGSFTSKQAAWATNRLAKAKVLPTFDQRLTYLFEIIYPENRIVVDYKEREDLVLLGAVDIATGLDVPLTNLFIGEEKDLPFSICKRHIFKNYNDVLACAKEEGEVFQNREGYVVVLRPCGFRVKVKLAAYKEVCKALQHCTPRRIRGLIQELGINRARAGELPAIVATAMKFDPRIKGIVQEVIECYTKHEEFTKGYLSFIRNMNRKAAAMFMKGLPHFHAVMALFDNRSAVHRIWSLVQEESSKEEVTIFYV